MIPFGHATCAPSKFNTVMSEKKEYTLDTIIGEISHPDEVHHESRLNFDEKVRSNNSNILGTNNH